MDGNSSVERTSSTRKASIVKKNDFPEAKLFFSQVVKDEGTEEEGDEGEIIEEEGEIDEEGEVEKEKEDEIEEEGVIDEEEEMRCEEEGEQKKGYQDVELNFKKLLGIKKTDVYPLENIYAKYMHSLDFGRGSLPMGVCYDKEMSVFFVVLEGKHKVKAFDVAGEVNTTLINQSSYPKLHRPSAITVISSSFRYAVLDYDSIIICTFDKNKDIRKADVPFSYYVLTNHAQEYRGLATTPAGHVATVSKQSVFVFDVQERTQLYYVNLEGPGDFSSPSFMSCNGQSLVVTDLGNGGVIFLFNVKTVRKHGREREMLVFEKKYDMRSTNDQVSRLGQFGFISGCQVDINDWVMVADAGRKTSPSLQLLNSDMKPVGLVNFDPRGTQKYTAGVSFGGNGYFVLCHRHLHCISIYKLEKREKREEKKEIVRRGVKRMIAFDYDPEDYAFLKRSTQSK